MTIYMVIADNCMSYECYAQWNEAAFASRKSAEDYIKNRIEEHYKDNERIGEIEETEKVRKLTDDEIAEYTGFNRKWYYDHIQYRIAPFDVRE